MEPTKNDAAPKEAASNKTEAPSKEATLVEAKEEAKNKRNRRIIIVIIIILLLLLGLYILLLMPSSPKPTSYGDTININQKVTMATSTLAAKRAKAIAESENFEMLQINLEGSGTNIFDFGETELFTLSNITSELYTTKSGEKTEIRAAISCQTSRRAFVEVEYFKSGEKNKKVFKNTYLGFNHILVIPALEPDSVYRYSISATDLNQTKIYSEQYVFYTGAGNISLIDVLGNAVQKVFGWAIGK